MGLRLIENEIGEKNGRTVRTLLQKAMPSGGRDTPGSNLAHFFTFTPSHRFCREKYLTAATYISSRAFTSSLLSAVPNLGHDPDAYPILIPGVDSLNHARAHPVSWVVSGKKDSYNDQGYTIAIVHHIAVAQGQELHNNYGPKPNAELVLGYGFSLPHNPDDTIILKLGGFESQRWEIGRDARNVKNLWLEILSNFLGPEGGEPTYEDILEAALSLQDMTEKLLGRLPQRNIPESHTVRPEVVAMFHNYIGGMTGSLIEISEFTLIPIM